MIDNKKMPPRGFPEVAFVFGAIRIWLCLPTPKFGFAPYDTNGCCCQPSEIARRGGGPDPGHKMRKTVFDIIC